MADLSKEYKKIMKQIDERFEEKEDRMFIKEKLADITMLYLDIVDRLTTIAEMRLGELEKKQLEIENKMSSVSDTVEEIENDIYDEGAFDFEIVCPYCNHEFVADIDLEEKAEIECPECHNLIELDWGIEDLEEVGVSKKEQTKTKQEEKQEEPPENEDDM